LLSAYVLQQRPSEFLLQMVADPAFGRSGCGSFPLFLRPGEKYVIQKTAESARFAGLSGGIDGRDDLGQPLLCLSLGQFVDPTQRLAPAVSVFPILGNP
jgi:hypothetical protein